MIIKSLDKDRKAFGRNIVIKILIKILIKI